MEPTKLLWNVEEAGEALGVSPWTIRRYIASGKLAVIRLNRLVFVEPAECQRLIQENRKPAKNDVSHAVVQNTSFTVQQMGSAC